MIFNPKEEMAKHLECLRGYAERVFVNGETLSPDEEEDRGFRMREFVTTGISFKCTERELVTLLYKGLFAVKRCCPGAGCFPARIRSTR